VSEIGTPQRAADRPGLVRALREPDPGILRQGLRFAVAGGIVAVVYLTTTTVLAEVFGLPFQAALAIGFCAGLLVHFTLQRLFVWTHHQEFALPLHYQVGRYLIVAAAQYGVTVAATALLPSALGVSAESVYLVTVAVVVSTNFVVFRYGIFHAKPAVSGRREEAPATQYDVIPAQIDPRPVGASQGQVKP
jgi:putative flippase GtrA